MEEVRDWLLDEFEIDMVSHEDNRGTGCTE